MRTPTLEWLVAQGLTEEEAQIFLEAWGPDRAPFIKPYPEKPAGFSVYLFRDNLYFFFNRWGSDFLYP